MEARFLRDIGLQMEAVSESERELCVKSEVFAPMGYVAWVCSDMELKKMNKIEYLTEKRGYKHKSYSIELPPVEKGCYHVFCRYDLKIPAGD